MTYGAVFATAVDATGGSLTLPVGTRDVENLRPVDLVESGVVLAEVLDLPLSGGFRHGACWGLLVPSDGHWLVVLMGTSPEELAGDGLEIGRLTDDDVHRWGPRFRGRDLRVAVVIDGTPGLDRVEVRFRSDLLARTGAPETPTAPAPAPPVGPAPTSSTPPPAAPPVPVTTADLPAASAAALAAAAASPSAAEWVAPASWAAPTGAPDPLVARGTTAPPEPEPALAGQVASAAEHVASTAEHVEPEPEPPVAQAIPGAVTTVIPDVAVFGEPAWSAPEPVPARAEDEPLTAAWLPAPVLEDAPGGATLAHDTAGDHAVEDLADASMAAGEPTVDAHDRSQAPTYVVPAVDAPAWEAPPEPIAADPVPDEAVEPWWSTAGLGPAPLGHDTMPDEDDLAGDRATTYDAAATHESAVDEQDTWAAAPVAQPIAEAAYGTPLDMPPDEASISVAHDEAVASTDEPAIDTALAAVGAAALDGPAEPGGDSSYDAGDSSYDAGDSSYDAPVVLTQRPPVTEADLEGVAGPPPPAGWYVDPHDERFWRYWDGAQWTPAAAAHPLPTAP